MSYSTPETVVSGVDYTVVEVHGRAPADLDDFVGRTTFRVEGLTGSHVIVGDGVRFSPTADSVRVHQKCPPDEKDVRPWTVHHGPDGTFGARPQ